MRTPAEFKQSALMCDWCCREYKKGPPPRCPKCGMMRLTQDEADKCCTPEGWREV